LQHRPKIKTGYPDAGRRLRDVAFSFGSDHVTTKFGDWVIFDLCIAGQSVCLTAHALGLAMVVAGLFDPDKANFGRGDTVFKKFRA
jgi:nitroreductase